MSPTDEVFYLGSPMFLTGAKTKDFHFLLDKVESKLKGWRSKSLSWAGRTTLIKSVAQALPTYTMSTFEVPTTIWTKIDFATRRFWWNPKTSSGSHLALKSWEALCLPHKQGVLGFRKRKEFKMALVSKMAWMVITNRNNSCMDLLRSKYKVRPDWLSRENCNAASPIWKGIEKKKPLLEKGACFQVGDGKSINVWKDPWIPWLTGFKPKLKNQSISLNPLMVSSLINFNTKSWKTDQLIELFDEESILAIQKITIPIRSRPEKLIWVNDPKGAFTVKSAYKTNQASTTDISGEKIWTKLWNLKVHDMIKMLLWRIGNNSTNKRSPRSKICYTRHQVLSL
jgi:hypothetical protein